jgi:hypothetical protein
MQHGIPVQLAWEVTLRGGLGVEDDATRAWNFWTGVYYKAGGIPWRVKGLNRDTCYVGIAFYRDKKKENLRTSMAQAFSDGGEGIVLRSDPFEWQSAVESRSPHMPRDLAAVLVRNVLKSFETVHHRKPSRIVIHKWQRFSDDEREGILDALKAEPNLREFDLVALGKRGFRFFRAGQEPPLRGTMIQLAEGNSLLFTRGYVPYLTRYPGMRVPVPVEIVEHIGSSAMSVVCGEILALTKMDWNSAAFAQKEPITTAFSSDVGDVLKEMRPDETPRPQYRYYM